MDIDEKRLGNEHAAFLVRRLRQWSRDGRFGTEYATPLAEAAEELLSELFGAHPELFAAETDDDDAT